MSSDEDVPSEARLEQALRDVVRRHYKLKLDSEELTVKRVRAAAESDIGLDDGFYKSHTSWNGKSKDVIRDEVKQQEDNPQPSSPVAPPPTRARPTKAHAPATEKRGTKRASFDSITKTRKRRKSSVSEDEAGDEAAGADRHTEVGSSETDNNARNEEASDAKKKDAAHPAKPEDSESELSSLIDEPAPKKRLKKSVASTAKAAKSKKAPAFKKEEKELPPDEAEIKRLQGWLIKCGIRKLWHRELATCDTSKEKINHLRGMLKDA
ncbi:hypothetical protein LTS18_009608, partial [Coniosporium uncinatum]